MKSNIAVLLSSVSVAALLASMPARAQQAPTPTSSPVIGITGKTSTAAEASHILKGAPGNLYSVYATNLTTTAGFLIVVNSPTVPGTGTLTGATVLDCVPPPASGAASINYGPNPPKVYSAGIVALLSSANTCYTFTNGTITGFISGSAP